jgi:excisionase family DNA binding protein
MKITPMNVLEPMRKPSKLDQKVASASYSALASVMEQLNCEQPEIEIEEGAEKIKIPLPALKLLGQILKAMGEGKMISLVPIATEVTTQAAAEMLGCSRPHLVKLLEEGEIAYTKVGKHRRIQFDDVVNYRQEMKQKQKQHIIDVMNADEETGLYDS